MKHKNTDLLVYYMNQVDDRYLRGSVANDSASLQDFLCNKSESKSPER